VPEAAVAWLLLLRSGLIAVSVKSRPMKDFGLFAVDKRFH